MRKPVASCGICGEQICLDVPAEHDASGQAKHQAELAAACDAHVRTHPQAEHALFSLRRTLDDLQPADRALAVRSVYAQLRELWGDSDRRGVYSIEDALGSVSTYWLWLQAHRCSYHGCHHGA